MYILTDDTPDTTNRSIKASKTVTVLSDVKISNKTTDLKHTTKMMNISSDDLLLSQVFENKMRSATKLQTVIKRIIYLKFD